MRLGTIPLIYIDRVVAETVQYNTIVRARGPLAVQPSSHVCQGPNEVTWCITSIYPSWGGSTRKNFDRYARVTFLALKFHNLFLFALLKMQVILRG